jgi:hypothetical protein
MSGLHFGPCIAGADCNYTSHFQALCVSLALKQELALKRWTNGLSVMLEKMLGVWLVSKLREILLMEADCNAMNEKVYGVRLMNNACKHKLVPDEIFSKKNKTVHDRGLAKTLFYDVSWQLR